ncbi:unnamed protein product [Rotaria sp. Silwood1]|nr:unnamed protein product [Rotaria sp. Silwood1]CAF1334441.1 unnamed protein product [Rotaria sp. Silwood1]CAF3563260.1 unnamed protein product [Rotaria sp. Silwood1]
MKKHSSFQRYQTEKAIIDALLKISEIIKKTTNIKQFSKKTTGDGDKRPQRYEYDYEQIYDGPIPPSMRTLESYVSGFNQQYAMSSSQRPSNFNRAPILLWNPRSQDKQYYSVSKKRISNDYRDRELAHKRYCYNRSSPSISSLSDNHYRRKSLRHHSKRKLSRSNKRQRINCGCHSSHDDYEYSASDC